MQRNFTNLVVLSAAILSILAGVSCRVRYYTEKDRLQLHYSPPFGWMNDPNGLVYQNGYYHLFYQYYPFKNIWGPMHWGHARSKNLIHWENQPVALKPTEKGDIFSGCCLDDADNLAGLGSADVKPMLAFYTIDKKGNQSQALAYSLDNGVKWTEYSANPIIPNPNLKDFRDPNIVKRGETFYMALSASDRIIFYSSTNLRSWTRLKEFGVSPSEVIFLI